MESILKFGQSLSGTFTDPSDRLAALYILSAIVIGFAIWLFSGRSRPFREWLLPREVYTHRSNLLDIKLFVTNKLVAFLGITGALFFPALVATSVLTLLTGKEAEPPMEPLGWGTSLAGTIVIVLVSDFCKYWAHRWHHELRALWPFHAVHHSADVLTPLTVMRVHPVETLVRNLLITALLGAVQGLMLFMLVGQVSIVTIGGANALYFIFNALGANLRHSHIWLSFGPVLEHVFISPAQHQIHHSTAVEHHDRNYGSMFALWDWVFGTLYIPAAKEELVFGVSDADGVRLEQPHKTLSAALLKPFRECWEALRPRRIEPPDASREEQA